MTRKEAINEYKARKIPRGAFAVRCTVTGQVWVGTSPNLDASKNGLWFGLRHASHRDQELQTAWNTHGEAAFQYEILELLKDDVSPLALRDLLKEKKLHWTKKFGATALL